MPFGKGTYGSKKGRPPKKTADKNKKSSKTTMKTYKRRKK